MAARTCAQCGTALTEGQRFCGKCGAPAPEPQPGPAPQPPQPPVEQPPQPQLAQPPPAQPPQPPTPEQATPPATWTPLPPAPAPTSLPPPEPVPERKAALPWTAWLGVGGCGLLAIATGLDWFAGINVNGFDIPMAALWSDTPTGSLPIAVPFLLIAAVGLAVAMLKPAPGSLGTTFLIAGAVSILLAILYVIRVLSTAQGVSILDVLSIGVWGVVLGSLAVLGAGVALLLRKT
jgi:hypothetical protein